MIKIFLTVRNRLEITKKCIHALKTHSKIPHSIYVYDNASNYLVENHFAYFCKMYTEGHIDQICFTTEKSTFNAFSKASTCNFFGQQHELDPKKNKYEFVVMLDNDIIVTPGWDIKLRDAWSYVYKNKMTDIKVIGQLPGGIKSKSKPIKINNTMNVCTGKLGGSGLWSVRSNFFTDVGFLDLSKLVGHDKKHDQLYWCLMERATNGKPYIMGVNQKLGIHCGKQVGSVCNVLTRSGRGEDRKEKIKFKHVEERLSKLKFEEFYKQIENDKKLIGDW